MGSGLRLVLLVPLAVVHPTITTTITTTTTTTHHVVYHRYNALFQLLLRLKRVQLRLEEAWQALGALDLWHERRHAGRRGAQGEARACAHACVRVRACACAAHMPAHMCV